MNSWVLKCDVEQIDGFRRIKQVVTDPGKKSAIKSAREQDGYFRSSLKIWIAGNGQAWDVTHPM